jgi:hypothetical protein
MNLQLAKQVGQIVEGRPPKAEINGTETVPFPRVTLKEAGIEGKVPFCLPATQTAMAIVAAAEGDRGIKSRQGREQRPAYKQTGIFAKFQKLFFTG